MAWPPHSRYDAPMFVFLLAIALSAPVEEIASPSGLGAGQPFLTTSSGGRLLMTWLEPSAKGHALRVSEWNGAWSAPVTITDRPDLFVNWADFPSIVVAADGRLYAHWLQKSGKGTYAYDVHVASSEDGQTWSRSRIVHRDGTQTEHGFVSMVPVARSSAGTVWLDGRQMKGEEGEMTLRYARVGPTGTLVRESVLDGRVCECCATGMAMTSNGPIVAYRDRSKDEVRDIGIVRWRKGGWSKPSLVHADGWKINGCPVNGPQIEARGRRVVVSWFTAAQEKGRVNVAFSSNAGETFDPPIRVDAGAPSGRVDLILLYDGSALVTWIEGLGEKAYIALRRVHPDGRMSQIRNVAESSAMRAAGFPRIALHGDELFLAWTDPARGPRVRLSRISVP